MQSTEIIQKEIVTEGQGDVKQRSGQSSYPQRSEARGSALIAVLPSFKSRGGADCHDLHWGDGEKDTTYILLWQELLMRAILSSVNSSSGKVEFVLNCSSSLKNHTQRAGSILQCTHPSLSYVRLNLMRESTP